MQVISSIERFAPAGRSSSPNRTPSNRADFTGSGIAPSSTGIVAAAYNNLLASSESVTASAYASSGNCVTVHGIEVKSKDFRKLRFYFGNKPERDRAIGMMQCWAFFGHSPAQIKLRVFAYPHAAAVLHLNNSSDDIISSSPHTPKSSAWLYDVDAEFSRLKFDTSKFSVNDYVNDDYSLCSSYPRRVIMPTSLGNSPIQSSAAFRSSGRFPTVCWIHPQNGATISRCSQPQVGIRGSRDAGDEALVGAIFGANPRIGNLSKPMYIIDCRPQTAAAANCTSLSCFHSNFGIGAQNSAAPL
jgi:hypothetical protein